MIKSNHLCRQCSIQPPYHRGVKIFMFERGLVQHSTVRPLFTFLHINNLDFLKKPTKHQNRKAVQKGHFFTHQPRRAKTRLSTGTAAHCLSRPAGRHPCLARQAYTEVPEHDKGPTRLRKKDLACKERPLACRPKAWRTLAVFFNSLPLDKARIGSLH